VFSHDKLVVVIDTLPVITTLYGNNILDPLVISLFGVVGVVWRVAVIFIFRDYRKWRNAGKMWEPFPDACEMTYFNGNLLAENLNALEGVKP